MNRRVFSQLVIAASLAPSFLKGESQTAPISAADVARLRFSVMLWTIDGKLPIERSMEIVAAAGYNGIEFVHEFQKWSPADFQRIQAKLRSLGLAVDAICGVEAGFSDPQGTDEFLAQLTAAIEIAKRLECPQIILLSGDRIESMPREKQHQACVENLMRAGDLVSRHNMQLVIEPIDPIENPPIYLTSVAEGFEIVRRVGNGNVKVLYDFYHEQRAAGNLIEKLEKNIDWVGLVHIADVPGRHAPGTGEIDYRNIHRTLARLHYDKFIAMEYFPTVDPAESFRNARLAALAAARSLPAPCRPAS